MAKCPRPPAFLMLPPEERAPDSAFIGLRRQPMDVGSPEPSLKIPPSGGTYSEPEDGAPRGMVVFSTRRHRAH